MLSPCAFLVTPWPCAEMSWPTTRKKVCKTLPHHRLGHPAWVVTRVVTPAREMDAPSLGHSVVFGDTSGG